MGILDRIGTIVRANVNSVLDKSSNPEADLNLFISDMRDGIKQSETAIQDALAAQKLAEINASEQRKKAQEWENKAQTAVRAGRDDLATEALRQKLAMDQDAEAYEKQAQDQKAVVENLRSQSEELKKKYAETEQNKGNLIARYNMGKYGEKVMGRDPVTGLPNSDYDRMQQKIMSQEIRAQMSQDEVKGAETEAAINKLREQETIDDELSALKQRMGNKSKTDSTPPKTEDATKKEDRPYTEK